VWGLLSLSLVVCFVTAGDEPRQDPPEPSVRLKKRIKPPTQPLLEHKPELPSKKVEPAKQAEPPGKPAEANENANASDGREQRVKEIISRVSKNLGVAQNRLDKNDPGENTQQAQRDIVKDLDELIEQTKRQQQQQQQSDGSSLRTKTQRTQQAGATQPNTAQLQPNQVHDQTGDEARDGNSPRSQISKIADLYKDIWGHLPETVRQEMDQYSREQFMAKYHELLEQYYATIAQKGRHKDAK
jgi:hypothetical protein